MFIFEINKLTNRHMKRLFVNLISLGLSSLTFAQEKGGFMDVLKMT